MGELLLRKALSCRNRIVAGLIDATSVSEMAALASLRNCIAHTYGTLDPARMAREAPVGLQAVERFLDQVTAAVTEA